jgi:hypothetical protein
MLVTLPVLWIVDYVVQQPNLGVFSQLFAVLFTGVLETTSIASSGTLLFSSQRT